MSVTEDSLRGGGAVIVPYLCTTQSGRGPYLLHPQIQSCHYTTQWVNSPLDILRSSNILGHWGESLVLSHKLIEQCSESRAGLNGDPDNSTTSLHTRPCLHSTDWEQGVTPTYLKNTRGTHTYTHTSVILTNLPWELDFISIAMVLSTPSTCSLSSNTSATESPVYVMRRTGTMYAYLGSALLSSCSPPKNLASFLYSP